MTHSLILEIKTTTDQTLAYTQIPAKDLIAKEFRDVIAKMSDVSVLLEGHITPFVEGITKTCEYYAEGTGSK